MLKYQDYVDETKDTIDVCEEQTAYLLALGLKDCCTHIGK